MVEPAAQPLTLRRYELRRLRLLAGMARGTSVLDLGYAQWPNPFLAREGREVTGLDADPPPAGCSYARTLVGSVLDVVRLVEGRRFDTVVAGELIEHVERPYDLIRGLREVLAPGGCLLVSTPNPLAFPVVLFEWMRSPRRFYTTDHAYYFPPRWVARMLERCGYRVTAVRGVGLWPLGLPCPSGLSYQVIYEAEPAG